MPHARKVVGGLLAVVLAGIGAGALLVSNDYQTEKPQLASRLWTAETTSGLVLHYMTREERQKRVAKGSSSRRGVATYINRNYSRYHLHARRAEDGQLLRMELIAKIENEKPGQEPDVLGSTSGTLWLWNLGGLEARDPVSLALLHSDADLRARNPKLAKWLPKEKSYFKNSALHGAMLFRGLDGTFYQIDSEACTIAPADEELIRSASARKQSLEEGFSLIRPAGQATFQTSYSSFAVKSFLTPTGKWYALLSDEERTGVSKWPSRLDSPYGEVARSQFRTDYVLDHRNKIVIEPANVEAAGETKFLQGSFLMRNWGKVWDVPEPSSTLVLFREKLGSAEPWHLARLTRDGQVVWKQSTGLPDFHEVADGGSCVILSGLLPADKKTRRRPEQIVWMNTKDGRRSAISIQDEPLGGNPQP